ncbi:MAG: acetyl-CoA carboxylase biotin carboxyl carrier protein subunit [Pyrinomonadaceae bacterium]
MKLKGTVSDTEHEVFLDRHVDWTAVEIDGRRYELEVYDSDYGEYLIIEGTNVYKCRIEERLDVKDCFTVVLRGDSVGVKIIDPKRLRSAQTSGAHDAGAAQIISPMAGKTVRVLVEVGSRVEAGAGIVVVEAMKMQNEMKAPKAGVVVAINAQDGGTVNAGDVLAVIE